MSLFASTQAAEINEDLSVYGLDPAITAKWDELQRTLHCCGGHNFLVRIWRQCFFELIFN
jgi:hypothetical protein